MNSTFKKTKKPIKSKKYTKSKYTYRSRLTAPAVKTMIKSELHRNIENKVQNTTSVSNVLTSYAVNAGLFVISLVPYANITQGTGQGQRIGNVITTRSIFFNFVLRPASYNSVYNPFPIPQIVLIFFGKVKNSRAQTPISSDFAKLWQTGSTSNAPYSNLLDTIAVLNRDWFTVYKSYQFKVGFSQADAAAGSNPAYEYYQNNDYKFNVTRKLNLTKYMPKKFIFNDATSQPTNDGLYMWAMCVPSDGSTGTAQIPIYMDYNTTYTYEDA
jgi:hypothetical protein